MTAKEPIPDLQRIFQLYRSLVYRVCCRYSKNREDAEDLTQEVFLKISNKISNFRADSSLTTWLYRVAVNTCLDHLRRLKLSQKFEIEQIDVKVMLNLSQAGNEVLARIDLEKIFKTVNPNTREALMLVLAEGLSYQEAADVMGMEKSAVAKRVSRFLEKRNNRGTLDRKSKFIPAIVHGVLAIFVKTL
jgi:RNA polymerase sigma-70 factor (ECF subfamily)